MQAGGVVHAVEGVGARFDEVSDCGVRGGQGRRGEGGAWEEA